MQFSNLEVLEDDHRLEIKNPTGITLEGIFTGIFALIWNAFIVVWCGMAIYSGFYFMILFAFFHAKAGISMGKEAFQLLFEHYQIIVSDGILTIRSKNPISDREQRFEAHKISQILVRLKKKVSSRHASHQLVLEMYDGSRIDINILSGNKDELFQIKRLLDNHIGRNNIHVSK